MREEGRGGEGGEGKRGRSGGKEREGDGGGRVMNRGSDAIGSIKLYLLSINL